MRSASFSMLKTASYSTSFLPRSLTNLTKLNRPRLRWPLENRNSQLLRHRKSPLDHQLNQLWEPEEPRCLVIPIPAPEIRATLRLTEIYRARLRTFTSVAMTTQEQFRKQAPPPLPPRSIQLPTAVEVTLKNGLAIVVLPDNRLPLVSYRLALRTGDAHDPADLPGLTDLLTGLVSEGTARSQQS